MNKSDAFEILSFTKALTNTKAPFKEFLICFLWTCGSSSKFLLFVSNSITEEKFLFSKTVNLLHTTALDDTTYLGQLFHKTVFVLDSFFSNL